MLPRPLNRPRARVLRLMPTAALLGITLGMPEGHAEGEVVQIDCQSLPIAATAELETRILASLLGVDAEAPEVAVACRTETVLVEVRSGARIARTEIPLNSTDLDVRILDAIDAALLAVSAPKQLQPVPSAVSSSASVSLPLKEKLEAGPVPAIAGTVRLKPGFVTLDELTARADVPSEPTRAVEPQEMLVRDRIAANIVAESWHGDLALGVAANAGRRWQRLLYGANLGGMVSSRSYRGFGAIEGTLSGELGYAVPVIRVDALAAAGASLLYWRAEKTYSSPNERGYLVLPYGEVRVARALLFGSFGMVVGMGLRIFAANRQINTNDQPELRIPTLVPRALLGVMYSW